MQASQGRRRTKYCRRSVAKSLINKEQKKLMLIPEQFKIKALKGLE